MVVPAPPSTRAQKNPFLWYEHLHGGMMVGRWDLQFNLGSKSCESDKYSSHAKVKVSSRKISTQF
jgi:hypothetical protein